MKTNPLNLLKPLLGKNHLSLEISRQLDTNLLLAKVIRVHNKPLHSQSQIVSDYSLYGLNALLLSGKLKNRITVSVVQNQLVNLKLDLSVLSEDILIKTEHILVNSKVPRVEDAPKGTLE